MKKHILSWICILFISLFLISCNNKKPQTELTSRIEYAVNILSPDADLDWWVQNIEGTKRNYLATSVLEFAATGNTVLEDMNYKSLSLDKIPDLLKINDSIHFVRNESVIDTFIRGEITSKNITRLLFREKWLSSEDPFEMGKQVIAICPVAVFFDNEGKEIYAKPLFWVNVGNSQASPTDRKITERIQYDVPIKNPNNKKDWWINNIEPQLRISFLNKIMSAAYSGKMQIFDPFKIKMTGEELKSSLNYSDTVRIAQSEPPYEEHDTVIVHKFDINDIHSIRFLEEWKLIPSSLELTKRIIGICPIVNSYNSNNEFRGIRPVFWIYFDPNYPEKLTEILNAPNKN